MAIYFKETLDALVTELVPDGIKLDWLASNAEDLTKYFHVYRNTSDVWPGDTDVAKIYATQFVDRPQVDGDYWYWVAYVNANGDHIVFTKSTSAVMFKYNEVYIPGRTIHTTDVGISAPSSALTTVDGENGLYIQSTTKGGVYPHGLGTSQRQYYFAGDTDAGILSSANLVMGGAGGTNTTPTQTVAGQMLGVINCNGYATNVSGAGNWTQEIATANAGLGTTAYNTAQIGIQAAENFACDAGGTNVTNSGAGFIVRLYPTATTMNGANRVAVIYHSANLAQYRTNYYQFRQGTTTTNSVDFRTDTFYLKNYAGTTTFLTLSNVAASFNVPVQNKVYTRAQAVAITGSAGMMICISDSPTNSNKPAYWNGTGWRYVADDSAI